MNNPEAKYRFGAISDTQERSGQSMNEALKPLHDLESSGVHLDFITHLGDLTGAGKLSVYVKEAKLLASQYDREQAEGQLSPEVIQYKKMLDSPEYQTFAKDLENQGVEQAIVIYALWHCQQKGELDGVLEDLEKLTKDIAQDLGKFQTEVKHIIGNADRAFPDKLAAVQRLLAEQDIVSYKQPSHLSLDDKNSVVFWPSMKVDKDDEKQITELEKTITELAKEMADKESVLIFAHETPFKGPKKPGVYESAVKKAGLGGAERIPHKQFLPISGYALELARRLPAKTKIAMTAGHMHVPRETIEAGTNYMKFDEEGKAKMRLFGLGRGTDKSKYEMAPKGKKRTVDLYYMPEGEVGIFEITNDGDIQYKNLSKDK